jgi:ribosomal protein L11 methyltransferase
LLKISPQVVIYDVDESAPALPPNAIALAQVKSAAFGDGTHPTTRLCAGAVDLLCRQRPGLSVLDVGTGTGILARIARARGATFIIATDIEPDALNAARANALLDRHTVEIQIAALAPDHWGARFDLVVANILEGPLTKLAPTLARALTPGGALLLSGFTRLQIPFLRNAFEKTGLTYAQESLLDGWTLIVFKS